jgi:hypothetical protein
VIEIKNYFENNKENILKFIEQEIYIFPKMFIENANDLHDTDFYENLKNKNNIFKYFFSIEKIKIFNIQRIKNTFFFKSDQLYKVMFLFFSDNHIIYLNDRKIKNQTFLNINSNDEIYIKDSDFLIISYLEKNIFSFEDLLIKINEKNLFNKIKINKFNIKDIFLKEVPFKDLSFKDKLFKNS